MVFRLYLVVLFLVAAAFFLGAAYAHPELAVFMRLNGTWVGAVPVGFLLGDMITPKEEGRRAAYWAANFFFGFAIFTLVMMVIMKENVPHLTLLVLLMLLYIDLFVSTAYLARYARQTEEEEPKQIQVLSPL